MCYEHRLWYMPRKDYVAYTTITDFADFTDKNLCHLRNPRFYFFTAETLKFRYNQLGLVFNGILSSSPPLRIGWRRIEVGLVGCAWVHGFGNLLVNFQDHLFGAVLAVFLLYFKSYPARAIIELVL